MEYIKQNDKTILELIKNGFNTNQKISIKRKNATSTSYEKIDSLIKRGLIIKNKNKKRYNEKILTLTGRGDKMLDYWKEKKELENKYQKILEDLK